MSQSNPRNLILVSIGKVTCKLYIPLLGYAEVALRILICFINNYYCFFYKKEKEKKERLIKGLTN